MASVLGFTEMYLVIGGLIASTLLTLVVIPAAYLAVPSKVDGEKD